MCALFTNADADTQADRVRMMTVHAAKGLEFPHVFLCGMNEGIFPSRKVRTRQEMEEERRLAFVALTRAQRGLYLSQAGGHLFDASPATPPALCSTSTTACCSSPRLPGRS